MGSSKSKSENMNNVNKTVENKEQEFNGDKESDMNQVIYICNTTNCCDKQPKRLLNYRTKEISEIKQSLESRM